MGKLKNMAGGLMLTAAVAMTPQGAVAEQKGGYQETVKQIMAVKAEKAKLKEKPIKEIERLLQEASPDEPTQKFIQKLRRAMDKTDDLTLLEECKIYLTQEGVDLYTIGVCFNRMDIASIEKTRKEIEAIKQDTAATRQDTAAMKKKGKEMEDAYVKGVIEFADSLSPQ